MPPAGVSHDECSLAWNGSQTRKASFVWVYLPSKSSPKFKIFDLFHTCHHIFSLWSPLLQCTYFTLSFFSSSESIKLTNMTISYFVLYQMFYTCNVILIYVQIYSNVMVYLVSMDVKKIKDILCTITTNKPVFIMIDYLQLKQGI